MNTTVHILATVRNPALLESALLVFKTVRVGFPRALIQVRGNGLDPVAADAVGLAASQSGCDFHNDNRTSHDAWIEKLIYTKGDPFWVCDTDLVFFEAVEHWFAGKPSVMHAGRFEPEFYEEWTRSRHMARLHTSLMYLNPVELRLGMRTWMGQFPTLWHTAQMNLIRQQFVPLLGELPLFYDTCAALYHALGGTAFTKEQNAAFEHLHCGTYADLIGAVTSLRDLAAVHRAVYADPSRARGLQHKQNDYYRRNVLVLGEASATLAAEADREQKEHYAI